MHGLATDQIKALAKIQPRVNTALTILDEAVEQFRPSRLFALFSGGYDSLCCTHVSAQHPLFSGVLHINTGIGVEKTRTFVRDTCQIFGWPLYEYRSPITYEDIIFEGGFPGPSLHTMVYSKLKERAIRRFMKDQKVGLHDRILLSTGARRQESRRRMGTAQKVRREHTRIWVNPLIDWSKEDIYDYMEGHQLPNNEVVALLHMSGECLCGCFGSQDELAMIDLWYPETGAYIHSLEERVLAAGFPWRWGQAPPSGWIAVKRGQLQLPGFDLEFLPLCTSCDARFERLQSQQAGTALGEEALAPAEERASQTPPSRIWTFEKNPLQESSVAQNKAREQEKSIERVSRRQVKDDIVGPFHPDDLKLLGRICAEHEVPFDLVMSLLQLERRYYGNLDRTDVQAGIHALLSRDLSQVESALVNQPVTANAKVDTALPVSSRTDKPEQLALW